jgi:hypothetical protein
VLPFDNMSGDPGQAYFSDGVTEDIITELSRFRSLFVIARNSSFALRGERLDVAEIARRLGVQFVVEGSVRRAGNRVRKLPSSSMWRLVRISGLSGMTGSWKTSLTSKTKSFEPLWQR